MTGRATCLICPYQRQRWDTYVSANLMNLTRAIKPPITRPKADCHLLRLKVVCSRSEQRKNLNPVPIFA
jgi:hypothetical protein